MWTDPVEPLKGSDLSLSGSLLGSLLKILTVRGIEPDRQFKPYVLHRIELAGSIERNKLAHLDLSGLDFGKVSRRLGWGSAITEFLIAPFHSPDLQRGAVASLGAVVNLMVVICDQLLDAGENVETVIPQEQLIGGGDSSPVTLLLAEYFRRLASLEPDTSKLGTFHRVSKRMFEAEIQTIRLGLNLPYRFWLRKNALQFVLMGLPAVLGATPDDLNRYRHYIGWLYRLGRFFGGLDDAMDLDEDARTGQPNYLLSQHEEKRPILIQRIAEGCSRVLSEWDAMVPEGSISAAHRQTFLHTVWGW